MSEELSEARKRSLANLRPWTSRPEGSGRKKGSISIITKIKQDLKANNGKKLKSLCNALLKQAEEGNATAINQIWDRIDGRLAEKHELEVSPLKILYDSPKEERKSKVKIG